MAASVDRAVELKRHLDEAFRAFEAGQDERARRLCRQALSIDPDNTTAHSLMGLLYEREGRAMEAASEFEHVVDVNPASEAERQTLRRLRGEEVREAEPVFYDDDEDDEERRRRVYTYAGIGALIVAMTVLFGFVVLSRMHNGGRGVTASVQKDLEMAQQHYERGRYEDAMESAQRVLAVQPENALAKQIYDRAKSHLGGARVATGPNRGADNTAPPPTQVMPALPQPLPAPQMPGQAAVPMPQTGVPNGGVVNNGGVRIPQPAPVYGYQGGVPSPAVGPMPPAPVGANTLRPGAEQYAGLNAQTANAARRWDTTQHPPMYPPRPMTPTSRGNAGNENFITSRPNPPSNPNAGAAPADLGATRSNIRVEVQHGAAPATPSTTGAEVAPKGDNEPAPRAGTAIDPAVQAEAERQLKLRQMRERGNR